MLSEDLELSYKATFKISAKECLVEMDNLTFPHAKDEWRKKYYKKVFTKAFPTSAETENKSVEDLAKLLAGGGR